MALFAIGDTHLSLSANKPMDVFGGGWTGYVDKLSAGFRALVAPEDTVVIAGDVSWGMSLEEAEKDFAFLDHGVQNDPLFCRARLYDPGNSP